MERSSSFPGFGVPVCSFWLAQYYRLVASGGCDERAFQLEEEIRSARFLACRHAGREMGSSAWARANASAQSDVVIDVGRLALGRHVIASCTFPFQQVRDSARSTASTLFTFAARRGLAHAAGGVARRRRCYAPSTRRWKVWNEQSTCSFSPLNRLTSKEKGKAKFRTMRRFLVRHTTLALKLRLGIRPFLPSVSPGLVCTDSGCEGTQPDGPR